MSYKFTKYIIYGLLFSAAVLSSCKDQWEDHNEVLNPDITINLFEKISGNTDLSTFSNYLVKTGFDKVIASSKTYTVWAPNNAALQNLDQDIVSDTAKLKEFVAYHISNQSYLTSTPSDTTLRVQTLSGKYVNFSKDSFEEASIVTADQYSRNGILHVIDKAVESRKNIWEYINGSATGLLEKNYLQSLSYIGFDSTKAIQTGVDPLTGKPIYKEGSGNVQRNTFFEKVYDLSDEKRQYTFILLTDGAYSDEYNKLTPFYSSNSTSVDSTTAYLSNWNVVKDLAVEGLYTLDQLGDTLTSAFGVKIPVNKNAIITSYKASNGIVYVMNSVNFTLSSKIPEIKVEGEYPRYFSRTDMSSKIFYRYKVDGGTPFNDIEVYGTAISQFYVSYRIWGIPTARYKVYWRAVSNTTGDLQTAAFSQQLSIGMWNAGTFPLTSVVPNTYSDVYLGEYQVTKYGNLDLFLVSAASVTSGVNTLILDYLKFVPVIQ